MKHKLESRLPGEISITSDMQMTPPLWQNVKGLSRVFSNTSWQIDGETVETMTDFIFLGSKITADGECSHEIKRRLLLGKRVMTNLDSILKSRHITLPTKVHLVKAMDYPVVMHGCESWTIKKAEHRRTDFLNCGVESPLDCKEIQPVHSEGDQPWDFFGRNDVKAETPILWPPDVKN